MAYTAQNIFDMSMDLLSKRSANGTIDATKTAKYLAQSPSILNIWQNTISRVGDLYSTHEFTTKPITNLLGDQFDVVPYTGTTSLVFEGNSLARAYYFEVDGEGTATIEDFNGSWNTLATITIPNTITYPTAYKGTLVPSSGATKSRITFSGSYYYFTSNRALFAEPFTSSKVPVYRRWVKHTMPTDFKSVDEIIEEDFRGYTQDANYKWEGKKDLYISYQFEGTIRIVYKPVPTKITAMTDTILVDDITCMSGAYFLATHLLLIEDPDSASFFNGMYEDLKKDADKKQPSSEHPVEDVYNTSNWGD